jgi:hypothetical protein
MEGRFIEADMTYTGCTTITKRVGSLPFSQHPTNDPHLQLNSLVHSLSYHIWKIASDKYI